MSLKIWRWSFQVTDLLPSQTDIQSAKVSFIYKARLEKEGRIKERIFTTEGEELKGYELDIK